MKEEPPETFLRRVVDGYPEEPRVVVTDKLARYGLELKQALPRTERRQRLPPSEESQRGQSQAADGRCAKCPSPAVRGPGPVAGVRPDSMPMFTRVPTPKGALSRASGIRWRPC